jgi:hypothetical protein
VSGDWRKLREEELHNLYSSPNIILVDKKEDEMGGACRDKKGICEKCFDLKA